MEIVFYNSVEIYGIIEIPTLKELDVTRQIVGHRKRMAWKDTAVNVKWVLVMELFNGSTTTQSSNCPFPLCGSSQLSTYNVTLSVNTAKYCYKNGMGVEEY